MEIGPLNWLGASYAAETACSMEIAHQPCVWQHLQHALMGVVLSFCPLGKVVSQCDNIRLGLQGLDAAPPHAAQLSWASCCHSCKWLWMRISHRRFAHQSEGLHWSLDLPFPFYLSAYMLYTTWICYLYTCAWHVTCFDNWPYSLHAKGVPIITAGCLKSRENGNPGMPIFTGCVDFHDTG